MWQALPRSDAPGARCGFGTGAAVLVSLLTAIGMTRRKFGKLLRQIFKMDIS